MPTDPPMSAARPSEPGRDPVRNPARPWAIAAGGWLGAFAWGGALVGATVFFGGLDLGPVGVAALVLAAAVFPGAVGPFAAVTARSLRGGVGAGLALGIAATGVVHAWTPGPFGGGGGLVPVLVTFALTGLLVATRWRSGALAVVGLGLVGAATIGAERAVIPEPAAASERGPNVLIVTLDGARADRFGTPGVATPAFDRLAAEGVRFDRAMTPVPRSGPAAAALLGHPAAPWEGASWPAGDRVPTELASRGYDTAAFVASLALDAALGTAAGFSVHDDDPGWVRGLRDAPLGRLLGMRGRPPFERRAGHTVDLALRWLRRADGPWFAWVHLTDPLPPYAPPPPFDTRYDRSVDPRNPARTPPWEDTPSWIDGVTDPEHVLARYDGEVAYADGQVARLLAWLDASGRADDTVVVLVGTSGQLLGEGGRWFTRDSLDEAALHVPLAARGPGIPAGLVVSEPVSTAIVAGLVRGCVAEGCVVPGGDGPVVSVLGGEHGVRYSVRDAGGRYHPEQDAYARITATGLRVPSAPPASVRTVPPPDVPSDPPVLRPGTARALAR